MLFADAAHELFFLGSAAVTALSTFGSGYVSYLSTRAKLRYDKQMAQLGSQVQSLTEKVEECHDERDGLRTEIRQLRDWLGDYLTPPPVPVNPLPAPQRGGGGEGSSGRTDAPPAGG